MTKPFSTTLRSADELIAHGLVPAAARDGLAAVTQRYQVAITPAMADLIDPADPGDPIARQFVPTEAELQTAAHELADPIGDEAYAPVRGIVHRYPDRVLLKLASVCPVYCRFCFRRESVGQGGEAALGAEDLAAAIAYIAATPQLFEVIVTGGDPLFLSPRRLAEVGEALACAAHVRVVRWHTRVPVVAPERIDKNLVNALQAATGKAVFVAIHCNHPRELTTAARAAISRLSGAGVSLVSQSVLLKGVNDDADVLERLMRELTALGVKPYYLHHADLAPGTGHLRVSIEAGQRIVAELRRRISGLAMPAYVLDIPGGFVKVPVAADHVGPVDPETRSRILVDRLGQRHVYRDPSTEPGT
ncbi:MAG: lysine-2,3-aminomutase-like protein [Hyphomicrobiaceae bacterium]